MENSPPRVPYIEDEIWESSPRIKLKEGMLSEINFAQFPREPSTAKSAPLHKGAIEYTFRIPKRSALSHKSIDDSALSTPKCQERALGRRRGLGTHRRTRLNRPWYRFEEPDSRILKGYCGAEGCGKAYPISYQAQGLCRGGRNARGRIKGIQTARIYCRWRLCPWQTKIIERESAMLPEVVPSSILKEVPSPMGQP